MGKREAARKASAQRTRMRRRKRHNKSGVLCITLIMLTMVGVMSLFQQTGCPGQRPADNEHYFLKKKHTALYDPGTEHGIIEKHANHDAADHKSPYIAAVFPIQHGKHHCCASNPKYEIFCTYQPYFMMDGRENWDRGRP